MPSQQPFLTQSDRIKALCDEAIKKPDITATEKTLDAPTGAPSLETSRLKVSAMQAAVEAAEQSVVAAPGEQAAAAEQPLRAEQAPQPDAKVEQHHTEQDQELASMLEERDQRLTKKKGRAKMLANVALLALFVTPVTVVAVNPDLRAKFEKTIHHLGEGVNDVKTMANTKESFDEALKEVAVRGDHINSATEMLGVDPNSVSEDDDLNMTAELREMMGDEADGFAVRKGKLAAMGTVAKGLSGMEETTLEDIQAAKGATTTAQQ